MALLGFECETEMAWARFSISANFGSFFGVAIGVGGGSWAVCAGCGMIAPQVERRQSRKSGIGETGNINGKVMSLYCTHSARSQDHSEVHWVVMPAFASNALM